MVGEIGQIVEGVDAAGVLVVVGPAGDSLIIGAELECVSAADNGEVFNDLVAVIGGSEALVPPGTCGRGAVGTDIGYDDLRPGPEFDERADFAGELKTQLVEVRVGEGRGELAEERVVGIGLRDLVRSRGRGCAGNSEAGGKVVAPGLLVCRVRAKSKRPKN